MIDEFFTAAYTAFQQAASKSSQISDSINLNGSIINLRFAGDAMRQKVLPALAHLATGQRPIPDLTICVWDWTSTGVPVPARPWLNADEAGHVHDFNSDRYRIIDQQQRYHGVDILHLYDSQQKLGLFHVPDADTIPYWIESFPLRLLLHSWTVDSMRQLVHAGAVGLPQGGVLLAGRGGSGKSTSVLACLDSELLYAADDYVMVELGARPIIASLYNTAKVDDHSLHMLPHLQPLISNPNRAAEDKAVIYLHPHFPDKLIRAFPLKAILVPTITGERDTLLKPTSAVKALTEIAPTTIFQLQSARDVTMSKLKQLTRSVPVYSFEIGTDLSQIPTTILNLIHQTEH